MKVNYGLDLSPLEKEMEAYLSNIFSLYVKSLNYHWNVEGERFISLHELFEKQYRALFEIIDEVAEFMRTGGFFVNGTLAHFQKMKTLEEGKQGRTPSEMIDDLAGDYESLMSDLRETIRKAEGLGDFALADFLTGNLAHYQKTAWMLRSQL